MIRISRTYKLSFDEYFYFRLWEKKEDEISEFISDHQRNYYHVKLNSALTAAVFNDKYKTYRAYKKYYAREVIRVNAGIKKNIDTILEFAKKHGKIVIKPIYGGCGAGVTMVDYLENNRDAIEDELFRKYENYDFPFICEELIIQDPEMGKLHPQSVNTVRITTIRTNNDVRIIYPFMRMGRGQSIVDNGGAGGILGGIDVESGIVNASIDELGYRYIKHPDTGENIIGFSIPKWHEVVQLAKELAMINPGNRYTGWDFALTEKGWIMVEGNMDGQFIGWQMLYQKGFKSELDSIMKEIYGRPLYL